MGIEYGNLITFVSVMASFPCSNALVECIFSCLKVINNKKRSPMKSKTSVALMQTKFAFKLSNQSAEHTLHNRKLPPSPTLLTDMKATAAVS